jgi:hypothetical protein
MEGGVGEAGEAGASTGLGVGDEAGGFAVAGGGELGVGGVEAGEGGLEA